jgi:hypothetical protein
MRRFQSGSRARVSFSGRRMIRISSFGLSARITDTVGGLVGRQRHSEVLCAGQVLDCRASSSKNVHFVTAITATL